MFKNFSSGSKLAKLAGVAFAAGIVAVSMYNSAPVKASDHDDGETNIKGRNLNLTDLYVFREDWQTGAAADNNNMIFVMNTNPRSVPRQHYFFNTNAVYTFWVSHRPTVDSPVTGIPDISFDFNFSAPGNNNTQSIFLNVRRFSNGQEVSRETLTVGQTTPAAPLVGNPAPVNNVVTSSGGNLTVFAGLREDPFFFDVQSFFRTRAALAGQASPNNGIPPRLTGLITAATNTPANAVDFAKDYNVNAIVMRVPIPILGVNTPDRVFDVWETISVPESLAAVQ